jgi:hypothetical protein
LDFGEETARHACLEQPSLLIPVIPIPLIRKIPLRFNLSRAVNPPRRRACPRKLAGHRVTAGPFRAKAPQFPICSKRKTSP